MTVKRSLIWLHLAVGVFTILLLIAIKSDASRLALIERLARTVHLLKKKDDLEIDGVHLIFFDGKSTYLYVVGILKHRTVLFSIRILAG